MGGETTDEEGEGANSCKPPARKKRYTRYNPHWATLSEFEWVRPTQEDHFSATCVLCPAKISVKYEFKAFMEGQHELLKAAKGDSKYTWKKRKGQQQTNKSRVSAGSSASLSGSSASFTGRESVPEQMEDGSSRPRSPSRLSAADSITSVSERQPGSQQREDGSSRPRDSRSRAADSRTSVSERQSVSRKKQSVLAWLLNSDVSNIG
ncbi:uncharacterized protein LOC121645169 isoform X1 [Melanotaenia boesemani]|uniref:uncharacterized protein LOC121645169 isoform X1 n=1 Tax=Melanotaenia boesemani TaxID=1250792 RepID=UPI001C05A7C8|nr:uncharacterized protein LOC121645169 isoform X1 [Melanotaenia boesemani]